MADYLAMGKAELEKEKAALEKSYQEYREKGLKLDMSRGKPCPEQLDLSTGLLGITDTRTEEGMDVRNYGCLEGIPEARRLFAELLGADARQVLVGGNSSLNLMFDVIRRRLPGRPRRRALGRLRTQKVPLPLAGL